MSPHPLTSALAGRELAMVMDQEKTAQKYMVLVLSLLLPSRQCGLLWVQRGKANLPVLTLAASRQQQD